MATIKRPLVVVILAALLAGCGEAAGPPTAQEILAKPNRVGLRDAHFVLTGKFINKGATVDISGDGAVVYRSAPQAGHFTFASTVGGHAITFEDIFINGADYGRILPGNPKWTVKPDTPGLGPTSFSGASDFKYLGEEELPLGRAWHVQAKDRTGNPFEGWIRERDGFPLRYLVLATNRQASTTMTLTFDRFNTGVTLAAPPSSEVVPG